MLLPRKGLPNAFVFTHTRKGRPLGEAILRKHFNQARDKLGFPKSLVLYGATRHSMATEGYNSTGDIIAVKEALGHRELTTTMKYTHVDISASSKIIKPKGKLLQTDISKSLPNKK
jgi:site-specific recombinase XerC